jgi:uncharacterized membrane protein YphA (DoxX/SURF4 family)
VTPSTTHSKGVRKPVTYVLSIVQALLALVFLLAGGMKIVTPLDVLYTQLPLPLPGVFIRFIGISEVLGAIGLILPGLTRIRPELTSLAARGLVLIMVGAVMFTPPTDLALAAIPAVVGLLAAFVAYGRAPRTAPRRTSSHAPRPRRTAQPSGLVF